MVPLVFPITRVRKKKKFEVFSKFIVLKAFLKDCAACRAD